MTADDRKALGPDGVALAEALGARDPSLHEALAARGYRAEPTQRRYSKAIVRVDAPAGSAPVFVGTAHEVWAWLEEGGAA